MTKPSLLAVLCLFGIAASSAGVTAQQPPTPTAARPGQTAPRPEMRPPTPPPPGRGPRAAVPQGFSVVLVLGDIQSAASSDDVPLAARKALADMKDFLPFKSYRLLDAAWGERPAPRDAPRCSRRRGSRRSWPWGWAP